MGAGAPLVSINDWLMLPSLAGNVCIDMLAPAVTGKIYYSGCIQVTWLDRSIATLKVIQWARLALNLIPTLVSLEARDVPLVDQLPSLPGVPILVSQDWHLMGRISIPVAIDNIVGLVSVADCNSRTCGHGVILSRWLDGGRSPLVISLPGTAPRQECRPRQTGTGAPTTRKRDPRPRKSRTLPALPRCLHLSSVRLCT